MNGERAGTRSWAVDQPVAGWAVIGACTYFIAAIGLLHVLRPDVSPMARVTSEYAVGPYGGLMTSAYFALSLGLVGLAVALARALNVSIRDTPGLWLLILAAAGTALAGLVPVDVGAARPVTPQGWMHRIAAIVAFTSMSAGPLLLAGPLRTNRGWRGVASLGLVVGGVGLAGLAAIQLFLLERGVAGAAQRLVLGLVITWMLAVAFRLVAESRMVQP